MPVYSITINVPANTKKDSPVTEEVVIEEKFIDHMEIVHEEGSGWMVGVRIMYGIKQWWPTYPDTWIYGNGEVISWDERFEMPAPNETLTIVCHSEGTKYDHSVNVRIMTLPLGFYFLETLLQKLHDLWEKIIGPLI
jgi:hypothetical protein